MNKVSHEVSNFLFDNVKEKIRSMYSDSESGFDFASSLESLYDVIINDFLEDEGKAIEILKTFSQKSEINFHEIACEFKEIFDIEDEPLESLYMVESFR